MQEIRDQTLEEGQQIAEEVLYAEVRFGELLDEQNPKSLRDDLGHVKKSLPEGVSLNMSSQYQKLAKYPETIERIAAKGREITRRVDCLPWRWVLSLPTAHQAAPPVPQAPSV